MGIWPEAWRRKPRGRGLAKPAPARPPARARLPAIDAARGLAILLMLVDHAAYFSHVNDMAETYAGRPPRLAHGLWFVTGLITNLSAPTFWLLGGTSIALMASRERRLNFTDDFLLIRAGALILIDMLLVSWEWNPLKPPHAVVSFELLTCLAVALLLLIPVRKLSDRWLVAITATLLAGYAALLRFVPQQIFERLPFPWRVLVTFDVNHPPIVTFPVLGWFALMTFGVWAGRRIADGRWSGPLPVLRIGLASIALGLAARLAGLGASTTWHAEQGLRALALMQKGPPAIDFIAINAGGGLLTLAGFLALGDGLRRRPARWLIDLGQAPLFLFVVHLLVAFACARAWLHVFRHPDALRFALTFITTAALLVPMARWYRRLKERHPDDLLHFL